MRVVQLLTALSTAEPNEEVVAHVTMPDGSVVVCDVTGQTQIGSGDGVALIVDKCVRADT